jgi:integrase/recombinase XerD
LAGTSLSDNHLQEKYLSDLELQGATKKTIENYKSCLSVYISWLHENKKSLLSVDSIDDKKIIEEFLRYLRHERKKENGQNLSFARIKAFFSALNSLYDYLEYDKFVKKNIILTVRKRYLKQFKNGYEPAERKIISINEMSSFLNSIPDLQSKVICLIFVKTGVRLNELIQMDVEDVDLIDMSILLKKRLFKKRSNPVVFFDEETRRLLEYWLKRRKLLASFSEKALFIGAYGKRISKNAVYDAVVKWAKRYGIYNCKSDRVEDHFSPHNLRHCFTTYLQMNGMNKDYIQELRGDKRTKTIDIYIHIDKEDLRREYLVAMPRFNVY